MCMMLFVVKFKFTTNVPKSIPMQGGFNYKCIGPSNILVRPYFDERDRTQTGDVMSVLYTVFRIHVYLQDPK